MDKPAEKTTRKRGDDLDRRSKKLRAAVEERDQVAVAEDEEVEEFFDILRRMHDAFQHFEKANGGGSNKVDASGEVRRKVLTDPVAEVKVADVDVETTPEKGRKESELFDLNSAPELSDGGGDDVVCE